MDSCDPELLVDLKYDHNFHYSDSNIKNVSTFNFQVRMLMVLVILVTKIVRKFQEITGSYKNLQIIETNLKKDFFKEQIFF